MRLGRTIAVTALAGIGTLIATAASAVPITFEGDLTDGTLRNGTVAADSLGTPSLWDFWTFSATAGDSVTVTVRRDPTGSDNDPVLGVWFGTESDTDEYSGICAASTNTPNIGCADDDLPDPGPFGDPQLDFVAGATGVYVVAVADHLSSTLCEDGAGAGCEYTIQVRGAQGAAIPEPATILLLGTALLGIGATRRWRR